MFIPKNSNITYSNIHFAHSFSQGFQIQNQLNSTSRTSFTSLANQSSTLDSKTISLKRKDQLKPTTKLNISVKKIQEDTNNKKSFQKNDKKDKYQMEERMMSTLSYNQIKPTFGLSKFIGLCGVERGEGMNGCQCFHQPCEWSLKWTKNYNPKHRKLYRNLIAERYDLKMAEQIQKDLPRTYPQCPTYSTNYQFRTKLRNILRIYTIYDIEAGYVQGMNMVAAVLLYHIKQQQQTFWAFVDLMDQQQLRLIYLSGFQSLKKHSRYIIAIINKNMPDLSQHMNKLDINPEVILYGWLLSLMSNCVPLEFMHLVIDKFRLQGWIFMYKLITTYLLFLKNGLLTCQDSAQFYSFLSNTNSKDLGSQWYQILENCYKLDI